MGCCGGNPDEDNVDGVDPVDLENPNSQESELDKFESRVEDSINNMNSNIAIGVGVAVLLVVCVGVYFGYRYYKADGDGGDDGGDGDGIPPVL
eukprot:710488_1